MYFVFIFSMFAVRIDPHRLIVSDKAHEKKMFLPAGGSCPPGYRDWYYNEESANDAEESTFL
jgi:hypothetical protein